MSKRNLIIAAVVLVVLAIISQWPDRSGNDQKDDKIGNSLLSPQLVESFDSMSLRNAQYTVTLNKKDDSWTIAEMDHYPADMKKLVELIDSLTTTTIASLVTKDEKRMEHFQVVYWDAANAGEKVSGTQLVLSNGDKEIYKMIAGKDRQSKSSRQDMPSYPDGVYARVGDNTIVYLLKEKPALDTDPEDWIMATLFSLDKKEIKSILFQLQAERFTLERSEKGKAIVLADLKEKEESADSQVSSVLSDLEEFKIDEIVSRSELSEGDLELKSIVTVTAFDIDPLQFQILAKLEKTEINESTKKEERTYSYYSSFVRPEEVKAESRWKRLYDLNKKWLFKMDDWKAERWFKERKEYIKK